MYVAARRLNRYDQMICHVSKYEGNMRRNACMSAEPRLHLYWFCQEQSVSSPSISIQARCKQ